MKKNIIYAQAILNADELLLNFVFKNKNKENLVMKTQTFFFLSEKKKNSVSLYASFATNTIIFREFFPTIFLK